jgi:quercetin dioxygenase-like cupin family protein
MRRLPIASMCTRRRIHHSNSPVKVDTKGLVAKIKFEAPLEGFLTEINRKYKLRVTELTLEPGGYVGEHNHEGPGIRQVTSGYMTYVLPEKTVVYGPAIAFTASWALVLSSCPRAPFYSEGQVRPQKGP